MFQQFDRAPAILAWHGLATEGPALSPRVNLPGFPGSPRIPRPSYCLNSADSENEEALTTGGFSATWGWGSSR